MSEALKGKPSVDYQEGVETFTIFEMKELNINITLDLPSALMLNKDEQEYYPRREDNSKVAAPVLTNNSGYDIQSATFSVRLYDLRPSNNVIANVQWFKVGKPLLQTLTFTCKDVKNGKQAQCTIADTEHAGYSRIRWATMANNGEGTTTLSCNVSPITLIFSPAASDQDKLVSGPYLQIG
nr:hypothetical protein FFPRI1PSEUD_39880 [Pseudomonas sp. FFPRI_1]